MSSTYYTAYTDACKTYHTITAYKTVFLQMKHWVRNMQKTSKLKIKTIFFKLCNFVGLYCTMCPTRYRSRHFFNNSNTNEDIATRFEQQYVRCVRNEKECVCSAPNCCDTEQRSASHPDSVASGTHCIIILQCTL